MKIAIISATSTIGQAAARNWAKKFEATQPAAANQNVETSALGSTLEFVLVGRNQASLEAIAADLKVRAPRVSTTVSAIDMTDQEQIEAAVGSFGQLDIALICQGELTDQATAQSDSKALQNSIEINAVSPALFAEAIARKFETQGFGRLAIIGSVAGDRGRKSNYSYGASKAFLATYGQGLVHRFAATKVAVLLIKPGPTASKMTLSLSNPPAKLADANLVAAQIVSAIDAEKRGVVYTPPIWAIIMLIVRSIPGVIFHRLNL